MWGLYAQGVVRGAQDVMQAQRCGRRPGAVGAAALRHHHPAPAMGQWSRLPRAAWLPRGRGAHGREWLHCRARVLACHKSAVPIANGLRHATPPPWLAPGAAPEWRGCPQQPWNPPCQAKAQHAVQPVLGAARHGPAACVHAVPPRLLPGLRGQAAGRGHGVPRVQRAALPHVRAPLAWPCPRAQALRPPQACMRPACCVRCAGASRRCRSCKTGPSTRCACVRWSRQAKAVRPAAARLAAWGGALQVWGPQCADQTCPCARRSSRCAARRPRSSCRPR